MPSRNIVYSLQYQCQNSGPRVHPDRATLIFAKINAKFCRGWPRLGRAGCDAGLGPEHSTCTHKVLSLNLSPIYQNVCCVLWPLVRRGGPQQRSHNKWQSIASWKTGSFFSWIRLNLVLQVSRHNNFKNPHKKTKAKSPSKYICMRAATVHCC